jgi:hypothetical protein
VKLDGVKEEELTVEGELNAEALRSQRRAKSGPLRQAQGYQCYLVGYSPSPLFFESD